MSGSIYSHPEEPSNLNTYYVPGIVLGAKYTSTICLSLVYYCYKLDLIYSSIVE
jgi:hypothetical protein